MFVVCCLLFLYSRIYIRSWLEICLVVGRWDVISIIIIISSHTGRSIGVPDDLSRVKSE